MLVVIVATNAVQRLRFLLITVLLQLAHLLRERNTIVKHSEHAHSLHCRGYWGSLVKIKLIKNCVLFQIYRVRVYFWVRPGFGDTAKAPKGNQNHERKNNLAGHGRRSWFICVVVRLNEQTSLNLLHIERVSVTKEQD